MAMNTYLDNACRAERRWMHSDHLGLARPVVVIMPAESLSNFRMFLLSERRMRNQGQPIPVGSFRRGVWGWSRARLPCLQRCRYGRDYGDCQSPTQARTWVWCFLGVSLRFKARKEGLFVLQGKCSREPWAFLAVRGFSSSSRLPLGRVQGSRFINLCPPPNCYQQSPFTTAIAQRSSMIHNPPAAYPYCPWTFTCSTLSLQSTRSVSLQCSGLPRIERRRSAFSRPRNVELGIDSRVICFTHRPRRRLPST